MRRNTRTLLLIALAALAVAAVAVYYARRTPFEDLPPRVGAYAPPIDLADLSGEMVRIQDHTGKVVLVNFWATWCSPCKRELEMFEGVYRKYEDRGFLIVAASIDEATADTVREMRLTYPVMVANDRLKQAYGNPSDVPVSFLVGRDGRIMKKVKKFYPEDVLEKDLTLALEAPAPPAGQ